MDVVGALPNIPPVVLFIIFVWSLIWKGLALWRSAQGQQRIWFVAILILNTMGILEIIYLFGFAKKKLTLSQISNSVTSLFGK